MADVATSRKRVELQVNQLEQQSAKLQGQAEKAISVGREDLAREALTRKSGLTGQISDLKAQHAQLQGEEEKLTLAQQRLQAKVESFRTRKETIKATYTAAEAQTKINEAMSGIGEEMGDVGMAIQRAEDKTAQMQARAGAIDELIASGALDDVSQVGGGDDIARELDAMSSGSDVEAELARLKAGCAARGDRGAADGRRHPPGRVGDREASHDHRRARVDRGPMIVRILGEGQFDVPDEALDTAQRARRAPSSRPSRPATTTLRPRPRRAAGRRTRPRRCRTRPGRLDTSDLILPPADASLEEVRDLLSGDGLIPG